MEEKWKLLRHWLWLAVVWKKNSEIQTQQVFAIEQLRANQTGENRKTISPTSPVGSKKVQQINQINPLEVRVLPLRFKSTVISRVDPGKSDTPKAE